MDLTLRGCVNFFFFDKYTSKCTLQTFAVQHCVLVLKTVVRLCKYAAMFSVQWLEQTLSDLFLYVCSIECCVREVKMASQKRTSR